MIGLREHFLNERQNKAPENLTINGEKMQILCEEDLDSIDDSSPACH